MGIGIIDIEYRLGSELCLTDDYCIEHRIDNQMVQQLRTNTSERYYRSNTEEIFDLGLECVHDVINRNNINRKDVAYLIYCHTSQANILPPPFSIVDTIKKKFSLYDTAGFSISQQNCVSPIHAINTLNYLMNAESAEKVAIVVTIDNILLEHLRRINDSGIQSDGTSAILIGKSVRSRNLISGINTYNDKRNLKGIMDDGSYEDNPNYLWNCTSIMRKSLRQVGIKGENVDTVCPQNTHKPSWSIVLNALGIPVSKLHDQGLRTIGHVLGSDVAINIKNSNAHKREGYHLIFSSGIGGCFGSFILSSHLENRLGVAQ